MEYFITDNISSLTSRVLKLIVIIIKLIYNCHPFENCACILTQNITQVFVLYVWEAVRQFIFKKSQ